MRVTRYRPDDEFYCDGPVHDLLCEQRAITAVPISVSHGYGSPLDGDEQHFCSVNCFQEWVEIFVGENSDADKNAGDIESYAN